MNKFKEKISNFIDNVILNIFIMTLNIRRWDKWISEIKKIKNLDIKVNITKDILENGQELNRHLFINRYLFIGKDINNG